MSTDEECNTRTVRCYGVNFSSPIPIIGSTEVEGPIDVAIEFGATPSRLDEATAGGHFWWASRDELLMSVPGVGRYHARRHGGITVERDPSHSGPDRIIDAVPMAAALGFLGLSVLHGASASDEHGDALVFVGRNGAGKSSLAAAMMLAGGQPMCDNLAPIDVFDSDVTLRPGPSTMRLWADMAAELGVDVSRSTKVNADMQKFIVERPTPPSSTPLRAIIEIVPSTEERPVLVALDRRRAIATIIDNHFRLSLMTAIEPRLVARAATIHAASPVYTLRRPARGWGPAALYEFIRAELVH